MVVFLSSFFQTDKDKTTTAQVVLHQLARNRPPFLGYTEAKRGNTLQLELENHGMFKVK